MDFSENFILKEQDEVQSAHWINNMLTIFTAVVWTCESTDSFAVVSDYLVHDKVAVLSYFNSILDLLCIAGKRLLIFTDGPSSQFKNRYILSSLPVIVAERALRSLEWHYFATSHGKGAVDGIGGEIKRLARTLIMSRRAQIRSLSDFVEHVRPGKIKVDILVTSHLKLWQALTIASYILQQF
jgi:hypothetical protein